MPLPKTEPNRWMMHLDDATLLSNLTIPGTHDTCALYGGDLPICQTQTIREQLDAGVRALDIRCRHFRNQFPIHHSYIYQHIDFGEVQNACLDFLRRNPSETVIMHIKEEHTSECNTQSFHTTFAEYILPSASSWYLRGSIPTLGEIRGKIVLLRRFVLDSPNLVMGIKALPWLDDQTFAINNNGTGLIIQDEYDIPTIANIDHKWDVVQNFCNRAANGIANLLFVNFTSGASGGAYPNAVAKGFAGQDGINKKLLSLFKTLPLKRYGSFTSTSLSTPIRNCFRQFME